MGQHYYNGAIKTHFEKVHKIRPSENLFIKNTKILKKLNKKDDLMLYEALLIKEIKPAINFQTQNFTRLLKIF